MTMDFVRQLEPLLILDALLASIAVLVIKSFASLILSRRSCQIYKLPPGPKPLPLVGNLMDLPKNYDWIHWAKHKDTYGPISSVTVFNQTIIILNDVQAAIDLFEKRSNIYSDRPTLTFAGEMCGWRDTLALQQYGDKCKTYRRYMHQLMGTYKTVERYHDLITDQTNMFLRLLYAKPNNLADHIRFFAGAITLRMLYGYEATTKGRDPLVELAKKTTYEFSDAILAGRWVVDTLPLLRHVPSWFPGATFKRIAKSYKRSIHEFTDRPFNFVQREMADGSALTSYTADLLGLDSPSAEKECIVKDSAAALYIGGTDTTVSIIHSFFLAMMLNPEVQRKAQAELDMAVGTNRLPTIEDRPKLPYIDAIVKEALRWNPVVPLGFPHVPSQDDVYQGYLFPKGAVIMPNVWLFAHDPENYKDHTEFRPERFLVTEGHSPERNPYDFVFGFGRRVCPGRIIADVELFLVIATSLSVFDVRPPTDENGKVIKEKYEFSETGLLNHPKDFACIIRPRSEGAVGLISDSEDPVRAEFGHAKKLLEMGWSTDVSPAHG